MRDFITVNQYAQGCHEDIFGDTDACIVGQPHGELTFIGGCRMWKLFHRCRKPCPNLFLTDTIQQFACLPFDVGI